MISVHLHQFFLSLLVFKSLHYSFNRSWCPVARRCYTPTRSSKPLASLKFKIFDMGTNRLSRGMCTTGTWSPYAAFYLAQDAHNHLNLSRCAKPSRSHNVKRPHTSCTYSLPYPHNTSSSLPDRGQCSYVVFRSKCLAMLMDVVLR